jgi:hypothetical protein
MSEMFKDCTNIPKVAMEWLLCYIKRLDGCAHWCCPECDQEICQDDDHVQGCVFLFLSKRREEIKNDVR